MTAQPADVHEHMRTANLAPEGGENAENGRRSARRPARARVIPHLRVVDQEETPEESSPTLGAQLLAEIAAESAAAAAESDFARQHLTPADAFYEMLPESGAARRNPIVWTAMALAGVARFVIVSLGHTIALAGETRIRAGVLSLLLLVALALSWAAGAAT